MKKNTFLLWALPILLLLGFSLKTKAQIEKKQPPKVYMMIADGFNADEFWDPYFAFHAAGYQVEVGVPEKRTIQCGNKNDGILNFEGKLTLQHVKPADYTGFFLTGGSSPENLEKYPRAIEICQIFDKANAPISTLCHGPRLLSKAGVLEGRYVTYLFRVRDELPQAFEQGKLGYYSDKPLVEDKNLLTARFPKDVEGLIRKSLEKYAENGGMALSDKEPRILVLDAGADRLYRHAFCKAALASHAQVKIVRPHYFPGFFEKDQYAPEKYDMLVLLNGKKADEFVKTKHFDKLLNDFENKSIVSAAEIAKKASRKMRKKMILLDSYSDSELKYHTVARNLKTVVDKAKETTVYKKQKQEKQYNAAICIEPDFDEVAFLGMKTLLEIEGYNVLVLSSEKGKVRSMNGLYALAEAAYGEKSLAKNALVVAPGGLWPDHDELSQREKKHLDYLLEKWQKNTNLVVFGFASYHLCNRPAFEGMPVASSDQTVWSFKKKHGKYTDQPVALTANNLITVKSPAHLKEAVQVMRQSGMLKPQAEK